LLEKFGTDNQWWRDTLITAEVLMPRLDEDGDGRLLTDDLYTVLTLLGVP